MPATIRLKRMGRKKQSSFRIVVAEKSTAITGPAIESLGIYQPRTEPSLVRLDAERALYWLRSGAMPSDTVKSIFRKTGLWEKYHDGVEPEDLTEKQIRLGPPEGQRKTARRARASAETVTSSEAEAAAEEVEEEAEDTESADVEAEAEEAAETSAGAHAGEDDEDEEEGVGEARPPEAEAGEETRPDASAEEAEETEEDASGDEEAEKE